MSDHPTGYTAVDEFLIETVSAARDYSEVAAAFLAVGDRAGTAYALRCLLAHAQAAAETLNDLKNDGGSDGS
jgi:hypothetical protein